MSIQQNYTPNLDRPEIYSFLQDSGPSRTWNAPPPSRRNYSVASTPKPVDSIAEREPTMPLRLSWAVHEWYEVTEGSRPGQVVGNFDVVVPMEHEVKVHVWSVLLLKDTVPPDIKQTIEAGFTQYQYPRDGDPYDYMRDKMSADTRITHDMFSVENTFSLEKVGAAIPHPEQRDALLDFYLGRSNGTIHRAPPGRGQNL